MTSLVLGSTVLARLLLLRATVALDMVPTTVVREMLYHSFGYHILRRTYYYLCHRRSMWLCRIQQSACGIIAVMTRGCRRNWCASGL